MSDIVDVAASAGVFSTLVKAVEAAGLVETLKGVGPFTVFAPTDEAFAKLSEGTLDNLLKPQNKDKLTAILTYHVVPGKLLANEVVGLHGKSINTVQGGELTFDASAGVRVGEANVTQTDVVASNGVIHVIDKVLIPA
ncbi:MAG: fasciclin domain-containing protein [Solirubrobacterales bacterium]